MQAGRYLTVMIKNGIAFTLSSPLSHFPLGKMVSEGLWAFRDIGKGMFCWGVHLDWVLL